VKHKSFTAKDTKAAKEKKSLTAKAAEQSQRNRPTVDFLRDEG